MEHVVFFTGSGAAQFRRTQSLDEAVRVVEHLRNVEGVDDARVYTLAEVPLAFKTVYRVEVQPSQAEAAPAPAPLPPMPPMPPMPDLSEAAPAPAAEAPQPAMAPAMAAPEAAPMAAPAPQLAPDPADPPVLAAVPSEPYEAAPEAPSNGKPRGMGFFSR